MGSESNSKQRNATLRVWDWGVRLLHWTLAVAIGVAWISKSDSASSLHEIAGYVAAGVVIVRMGWGVIGGRRSARLARCLRFPRQISTYLSHLMQNRERRYLGHNPLGSVMVIVLLVCVASVSFTGWLFTTDQFWGYGWLSTLHEVLAWSLVLLVILHVVGVIFTALRHRENLVAAMITGNKLRRVTPYSSTGKSSD
jgi:cytochrome b